MFQNIVDVEKEDTSTQEEVQIDKKENIKKILKKLFTKQNILCIFYHLCFQWLVE